MRIETPEVKREDGSKFKMVVVVGEYNYGKLSWRLDDVAVKPPRKKNWDYQKWGIENSLRGMDFNEKNETIQQKLTDLVGEEWVKKAFQYAYDYIKPDILK